MPCFEAFVGFIWASVSPALESFLQILATESFTWFRNWGAERIPRAPFSDSRVENSRRLIVGAEDALSEIRGLLCDDNCKFIGIYGMGGIGKSTLLLEMEKEFSGDRSGRFDPVIFVSVARDVQVDLLQKKIQEDILDRLGLRQKKIQKDEEGSDHTDTIFNALRQKKFLLLLDSLWDKLDLVEIGVPVFPNSRQGSKIAFTTRSAEVCNDMGAAQSKLKMPLLSRESSWELFCQNLGNAQDEWSDSTRDLAREVASKCEGLPLALITVARAMADVTDHREWEGALVTLGSAAGELRNMEENVLRSLKFSYDRLREERHKECLLYCSLFPEYDGITTDGLIEYWFGEGLLDKGDLTCSIDIARDRGLRVITDLKAACLLQDGGPDGRHVKLHDVVRQMTVWITSGECEGEKTVFLVNPMDGLEPTAERWTDSTRISLMYNRVSKLPERVDCRNLRTLLLRENHSLSQIQGGFFQYMPILTVLDLYWTDLKLLPPEICLLVELRFLDLSWTKLESLPREVGRLTKLRLLNLSDTPRLKRIPPEAISSLSRLQWLSTYEGGYEWRGGWKDDGDDGGGERCVCMKDLVGLAQLDELRLSISFKSQEDIQALLDSRSRRLFSAIRYLCLSLFENSSSLELCEFFGVIQDIRKLEISSYSHLNQLIFPANQLTKLEYLTLWVPPLETISWKHVSPVRQPTQGANFKNLLSLQFFECVSLEEITWTKELPSLENLFLNGCSKMVEMIVIDESVMKGADKTRNSFFPKLREIRLWSMMNLKSICGQPLLFPALKRVDVNDCPELKKLPFGLHSAKNIKRISITKGRGNDLEWDSEAIRSKFTPYLYVKQI